MDISVVHDVRNEGLGAGMGAQSPKHAAELKRYVDRYGCRDVVCGPPDFWALLQEMGPDFAMGPGLLCGFRRALSAVGLADLGKRRRVAAFRAYSACETAQKFAGDFGD